MHIAIVGAGISGLISARQLQSQGHQITVFEKSDEVSGRMATRQTEFGGFDYGAQYFTARNDQFKNEVAKWLELEWILPWDGKLAQLENTISAPVKQSMQAYVPVPSMSALAEHLATGIEVRKESHVVAIEQQHKKWLLSVRSDQNATPVMSAPFDAVIFAMPPEQAAPLLKGHETFSKICESVHLEPCWSLMLGFQAPLDLPYDGAWVTQSRLGWIARDTSKPNHRAGERWICHATGAWSKEHLEDDHERAKDKLIKAFYEATGTPIQAIHSSAYRWRFAQACSTVDDSFLWDKNLNLGLCGDWFAAGLEGTGRIENAVLSAMALSESIA